MTIPATETSFDILKPWDALRESARLLQALLERQQRGELTDAEEITLAHALAGFAEAHRWSPA